MRSFATTLLFTLLLSGGTALAAQNVANTSQKGSLLIWPLINIEGSADTIIEISNDASGTVQVVCYYVNEKKARVDFSFPMTGKATASWSVRYHYGDEATPAAFPIGGSYVPGPGYAPVSAYRGELVCFTTNQDSSAQVAFNHLTGTATVLDSDPEAFRYNAWSFVARNAAGLPEANRVLQGTPGRLDLTGNGAGTYDACPAYNIANFSPNGAYLYPLYTLSNTLTVVSCNQDLRQDFDLNLTKLQFTVWNSKERRFTGAHICVDSVNSVRLGAESENLVNGSHFEASTLQTANARFHVSGVASAVQCPGSTRSGLLGVLASSIYNYIGEGNYYSGIGSTTHGAGAASGFVLWDPSEPTPFKPN